MYIVELTYIKAMSEVDNHLEAHRSFLDTQYALGNFLASGPKNPRDGGVILVKEMDRTELDKILKLDPFFSEEISQFKITEFAVTKRSAQFHY
jgi:uncharacterized protein YciI